MKCLNNKRILNISQLSGVFHFKYSIKQELKGAKRLRSQVTGYVCVMHTPTAMHAIKH